LQLQAIILLQVVDLKGQHKKKLKMSFTGSVKTPKWIAKEAHFKSATGMALCGSVR
jgi:hypothetical protein